MPGVAIVAIPSDNDYVWKISSEKVPHLTLLFLGDMTPGPDLALIETFLSHVVTTSMWRFGLSVHNRGVLGPDSADVVFFRKNDYETKMVAAARTDLLANPTIRAAYNSVQQFPEWTPHLTLGYPATPARPDTREYPGISWVNFDKIALWTGDFDGPTFTLEDRGYGEEVALAMSDNFAAKVLEHHGVKGMKWGVRRDSSISSMSVKTSKLRLSSTDVTAKQKPGQFVRTSGGKRQTASDEAISVAGTRQLAKKSTTDALTNKQLQDAVTRMNLEQQYHTLVKKTNRQTRGQRFVQALFGTKKTVDKSGNPIPGTGQSVASKAAELIGELLKKKSATA